MLVIYIALGIVLGYLILAFLPQILFLGFSAIALIIALIIAGGLIYLILGNAVLIMWIGIGIISYILFQKWSIKGRADQKAKELSDAISYLASLGHDTSELEKELSRVINSMSFEANAGKEKMRRRALGYDK